MSEIFPYLWSAMVLLVFLTSLKLIWGAVRNGVIPDSVWGGADNYDDHYGFMLRLLMLVGAAGISLFMITRIPEMFELLGP